MSKMYKTHLQASVVSKIVEQHSSTRSTRRARLAGHARLDALDTSNVSFCVET